MTRAPGPAYTGSIMLPLMSPQDVKRKLEAGEIRLLDLSRRRRETEYTRAATMRLGALYEERGAFETAMEQYGRLVDTCSDPETCAAALLSRGLIRYRMGSFQAALDDFVRIREKLSATRPAACLTSSRRPSSSTRRSSP